MSGSYSNNCEVKYFKYFANSVCTEEDLAKLADCSDDDC